MVKAGVRAERGRERKKRWFRASSRTGCGASAPLKQAQARRPLAQDDYYYEIQLTNKQLVFYFMAGATGLILSFLAGVMVGRGVDASGEVQAARPVAEERIVAEEPRSGPRPAPAEDLTYAQRLEGDKPQEDSLESKPRPAATPSVRAAKPTPPPKAVAPAHPGAPRRAWPRRPPLRPPSLKPAPAAAKTAPKPSPPAAAAPPSGLSSFTIQVGAFKDKATADSVVTRLKGKGFAAYIVAPEEPGAGLFRVRVGSYPARADAERVQAKLRDQEKFKPSIVKN